MMRLHMLSMVWCACGACVRSLCSSYKGCSGQSFQRVRRRSDPVSTQQQMVTCDTTRMGKGGLGGVGGGGSGQGQAVPIRRATSTRRVMFGRCSL